MKVKQTILCILTTLPIATSGALAEDIILPIRATPIPTTTNSVPHVQVDVKLNPALSADLLRRVSAIPGVEIRETVISLPGAKGFWLDETVPLSRPDTIVGGREFAHLHPDGSLHASLSPEMARKAFAAGWATPHPWSATRRGWQVFVMIYTASSPDELDTVFQLVLNSYNFVTGRNLAKTDSELRPGL